MFREKEICNAIRTAYLYLFPDKKERKRALSRLNIYNYHGGANVVFDDPDNLNWVISHSKG